ncbi:MAG: thioredoxin [Alphaproteobacteria bacterium]|nr:thioredoxin [Alphaproteobacteria bacterium]
MLKKITDEEFEKIITESDVPVLVDFWAEWCGPCRMITPILESVSEEYGSKILMVKMNIDENPQVPSAIGIKSIPTIMIFKAGELLDTKIGMVQKNDLKTWIDSIL